MVKKVQKEKRIPFSCRQLESLEGNASTDEEANEL